MNQIPTYGFRLQMVNGDQVVKDLQLVGDQAQRVFRELERAAKSDAGVQSVERAFRRLGVTSEAEALRIKKQYVDAFNAIRKSGTASAEEIARARTALEGKVRDLNAQIGRGTKTAAEGAAGGFAGLFGGSLGGAMDDLASRAGLVGSVLRGLGPLGVAAGAGIGLATTAIVALNGALSAAGEAERSERRLDAVLQATGHAAGLASHQIVALSDAMERSRLVEAEAVQDAAAALATFKSVQGEVFLDGLRLAQDMAAVFGGDLRSSAVQLGKALEEPTQGITALRRAGVTFTAAQKELIARLDQTGDKAAAQRVILKALEEQLGGAGAAEGKGAAGAAHRLGTALGNLYEALGRTAPAGWLLSAKEGLAEAAQSLADMLEGKEDLDRAIADVKRQIADIPQMHVIDAPGFENQSQLIEALQAELAELEARRNAAEAKRQAAEGEAADQAAQARARANAERLVELEEEAAAERLKEGADYAAKREAIEKQAIERLNVLWALRGQEGIDVRRVDALMGTVLGRAERRIAELDSQLLQQVGIKSMHAWATEIGAAERAVTLLVAAQRAGRASDAEVTAAKQALVEKVAALREQLTGAAKAVSDMQSSMSGLGLDSTAALAGEYAALQHRLSELGQAYRAGRLPQAEFAAGVHAGGEALADLNRRRILVAAGMQETMKAFAGLGVETAEATVRQRDGVVGMFAEINAGYARGVVAVGDYNAAILATVRALGELDRGLSSLSEAELTERFGTAAALIKPALDEQRQLLDELKAASGGAAAASFLAGYTEEQNAALRQRIDQASQPIDPDEAEERGRAVGRRFVEGLGQEGGLDFEQWLAVKATPQAGDLLARLGLGERQIEAIAGPMGQLAAALAAIGQQAPAALSPAVQYTNALAMASAQAVPPVAALAQWYERLRTAAGAAAMPTAPARGFAGGGHVRGPGTSTSDSIPARLSDWEFVQPARAVRHYGLGFMEAVRTLRLPRFSFAGLGEQMANAVRRPAVPRFAEGGLASAAPGRPLNLTIGGEAFALSASEDVAAALIRHARRQGLKQPGRAPSRLGHPVR